MLAYYFNIRGYPIDTDMPSDDRPDLADALLGRAFTWLDNTHNEEMGR